MKLSFKGFFSPAYLVTFTEVILNAKLNFLCSFSWSKSSGVTRRFKRVKQVSIHYLRNISWKTNIPYQELSFSEYFILPAITCSNLTIDKLEQVVNFAHTSHLVLVFLLLTLSR